MIIIILETIRTVFLFLLNIFIPRFVHNMKGLLHICSTEYYIMKYPFFASFILFIIFLKIRMRYLEKKENKANDDFLQRESKANATRRKSLDNLRYIHIPFDNLPSSYDEELVALSKQKIVNFTGYTNTDLKMMYGPANMNALMEYDAAFTQLVCNLQKWAETLIADGQKDDALCVLEYAVEIESDLYSTYSALAELYLETGQAEKIDTLKTRATTLRSLNQKKILNMLSQMDVSKLLL